MLQLRILFLAPGEKSLLQHRIETSVPSYSDKSNIVHIIETLVFWANRMDGWQVILDWQPGTCFLPKLRWIEITKNVWNISNLISIDSIKYNVPSAVTAADWLLTNTAIKVTHRSIEMISHTFYKNTKPNELLWKLALVLTPSVDLYVHRFQGSSSSEGSIHIIPRPSSPLPSTCLQPAFYG